MEALARKTLPSKAKIVKTSTNEIIIQEIITILGIITRGRSYNKKLKIVMSLTSHCKLDINIRGVEAGIVKHLLYKNNKRSSIRQFTQEMSWRNRVKFAKMLLNNGNVVVTR